MGCDRSGGPRQQTLHGDGCPSYQKNRSSRTGRLNQRGRPSHRLPLRRKAAGLGRLGRRVRPLAHRSFRAGWGAGAHFAEARPRWLCFLPVTALPSLSPSLQNNVLPPLPSVSRPVHRGSVARARVDARPRELAEHAGRRSPSGEQADDARAERALPGEPDFDGPPALADANYTCFPAGPTANGTAAGECAFAR